MSRGGEPRSGAAEPRIAVFLDRDGTVIHDRHYLSDPAGVELISGAGGAIARLNRAGIPAILVTNQSGIGRGLLTEEEFFETQDRLAELLRAEGAWLDAVYYCPHSPDDGCDCRKPEPGLYLRAAGEHGLELSRSFYVGDRGRDVEPAVRFRGTPILIAHGVTDAEILPVGTIVVADLVQAVSEIMRLSAD